MTRRGAVGPVGFVLTLAAALAPAIVATPAAAQVTVHDHSRDADRPGPTVTGFAPQGGPVGTLVTIAGSGLARPNLVVLFGGRPVRIESAGDNEVRFVVPGRWGDGAIVLRVPGAGGAPGSDLPVGSFAVVELPLVSGFTPAGGPAGTRVEIRGSGFLPGDQVFLGRRALAIAELAPDRIVVTIPAGAPSDVFTVARTGAPPAASVARFQAMPPVVEGFSPAAGPPGTVVRIRGFGFGPDDVVLYGRLPVQVVQRHEHGVEVVVPANARKSEPFCIRGAGHPDVATAAPFALLVNPSISSFAPTSGGPGTRVEIFGSMFQPRDTVYLGARALPVLGVDENRIVVSIPPGVQSDVFTVLRAGQIVASSRAPFDVTYQPSISGLTPAQGPPGTQVRIAGAGFAGEVRVFYGPLEVPILGREGTSQITVQVPRAAVAPAAFVVQTRIGQAQSAAFLLSGYAGVDAVVPGSGPPGTRVTIRGWFSGGESFYLGGAALPILDRQPGQVVVQIPPGATTGQLEVESFGTRATTRFRFEVLAPPLGIASFSPDTGSAGTEVTLYGQGFTPTTSVWFHKDVPCEVLRRGPNAITIRLPYAVRGRHRFVVTDEAGNRAVSQGRFEVVEY
jgi:IPT/TIG domain-containing protein